MEMAAGVVLLPILLLLGLLLLGGLVLTVVLIVNPRTRPVGVVLAVIGGLLVCGVVVGGALLWVSASHEEVATANRLERMGEDLRPAPPLPTPFPEPVTSTIEQPEAGSASEEPTSEPSEPAEPAGAAETATSPAEEPTEPAASETPSGAGGEGTHSGGEEAGSGGGPSGEAKPDGSHEPDSDHAPAEEASAEPAAAAASEAPAALPGQSPPSEQARPEWVESRPQRVGDGYQMSITVGPYTSRMECDAHLPAALQAAVEEYVSIYLGPQWAGRIRLSSQVLQSQLVKDQWEETIQASVGPMVQLHVLLQFDARFRQMVIALRDRSIVAGRLWLAGTGLGVVLAWLALAFAFLRIEQATAGAYRGRLVAGCILAAVAVLLVAGAVLHAVQPVAFVVERLPEGGESGNISPTVADVLSAPAPSEQLSLARAMEAEAHAHAADGRLSILALLVGMLGFAGLAVLLACRRTRVIGVVLLAVVVVGALFLVA